MGDNLMYRITPMKTDAIQPRRHDQFVASPYNYAQDIVRNSIVKAHTLKYKLPMLYQYRRIADRNCF
jgi:NAD+ synthase (glutamine-hydrolysing)